MSSLKRIQVGKFNIKDAVNIDELENKNIISLEELFQDKMMVRLDNSKLKLFLNGVRLNVNLNDDIYRVYNDNDFIGIGVVQNKLLKRDIII